MRRDHAVNRDRSRSIYRGGGLLTVTAAGCGEPQKVPESGTIGTNADFGEIQLRNVHLRPPDGHAFRPGDDYVVSLVAWHGSRVVASTGVLMISVVMKMGFLDFLDAQRRSGFGPSRLVSGLATREKTAPSAQHDLLFLLVRRSTRLADLRTPEVKMLLGLERCRRAVTLMADSGRTSGQGLLV
ncbi:hypothetical protein [Lentzea sp. E54]|uniref:hypothetical protein n=1 Tax=Lentzea xerophila TaxID=3435883 RepID=UPI003DA551E1